MNTDNEYMPTFADRMNSDEQKIQAIMEANRAEKLERMRFEAACAAMQGFCASNDKEWDAKDCVEHADDLLSALYPEVAK